jgi:fatty acid desaturase
MITKDSNLETVTTTSARQWTATSSEARLAEKQLCDLITGIVGQEMLRSFRRIDARQTLKDLVIIYILLASAIAAVCWLHCSIGGWTILFMPTISVISGIAFNWINVQVHEASHYLLWENKRLNDIYCNVLLASLALQDVNTYRATHAMHHTRLHSESDPDLYIYRLNGKGMSELLSNILEDLTLQSAFRRKRFVSQFISANNLPFKGAPAYSSLAKALAQLFVLSCLWKFCGFWAIAYYGSFYLYGLLAVFPALVRVRTVVQHFDPSLLQSKLEQSAPPFIARTTIAPFFEFLTIGARMDYHFEHHLFPNLPYYNLANMHKMLKDAGLFRAKELAAMHASTANYIEQYFSFFGAAKS